MTIKRFETGHRMSQAVTSGGTVYLAGQVGKTDGDVAKQMQQALDAVDRLLAEVGSEKAKLLQVTIWLSDMADFDAMNVVYDAWVDRENAPTRACGQSKLATPDHLVEIIAVAAV